VTPSTWNFGSNTQTDRVWAKSTIFYLFSLVAPQGRLIQWARWARAQGPQASGGPQTAHALFFISW